jgi:DNA-binding LacI/PurR family transcriptional regulator
MAAKIKDIANALNVSASTVSLVLNNKPGVGTDTRERVLNYVNANGLNINTRKNLLNNKSIGFIIYKKHGKVVSDTPFFSQVIEGIEAEARKNGYNLSITYVNAAEKGAGLMRYLKQNSPEGVILLATEMEQKDLQEFERMNIPFVFLDNSFADEHVDSVFIGNERASCEAVSYLIETGHHDVGYLHSAVHINNFDSRQKGYCLALMKHGIPAKEEDVFLLDSTIEGAYEDMRRILAGGRKIPAALFADNDIIAVGAMKAIKEFGLRIPEDISVIGFDDMPYCELADPPLSTVRVSKQYMGRLAVRRLVEKIESHESKADYVKIEVGTQLVLRKSVSNQRRKTLKQECTAG